MTTARASKAAERLVKRTELELAPEYIAEIIEGAAEIQALEDERDKLHGEVINMAIKIDRLVSVCRGLLADRDSGVARTMAQIVLSEAGPA